jgi:membrane protein
MFKQGCKCCLTVVTRFFQEGIPIQAAALAYITLLSIVPFMTVSLSVLTAFPVFQGLGSKIQEFIFSNFVASVAQVVQQQLQTFINQTKTLSVPGTFFLLITAILVIFAMEYVFNKIWRVQRRRNLVQAFVMYWAVLTLTPILIGTGFLISSYLITSPFISVIIKPGVRDILLAVSPYLFTFFAFTLLYVVIPNCKVKVWHAAIGAMVATLLFELAKYGFTFYIINFPVYRLIYGALAIIPIFLVWLYLSWVIILLGALVSHSVGANFSAQVK